MVPIPKSNLVLVVFDVNECPVPGTTKISIVPREEVYSNESLPCHRKNILPKLSRRRPFSCITHHVNVSMFL